MFRTFLTAAALTLTTLSAPAAAAGHGCQTVQFARGAYAHTMYGQADPYSAQCYYLAVRPGQRARVRIVYGAAFLSTNQTQGTYQDVQFTTINGQLFVYVHTDYAAPQPYTIEFVFV